MAAVRTIPDKSTINLNDQDLLNLINKIIQQIEKGIGFKKEILPFEAIWVALLFLNIEASGEDLARAFYLHWSKSS